MNEIELDKLNKQIKQLNETSNEYISKKIEIIELLVKLIKEKQL